MSRKIIRNLERNLERARKEKANTGGIKMLPTQVHDAEAPVRQKNVPVILHGNKVNLDDYEDWA